MSAFLKHGDQYKKEDSISFIILPFPPVKLNFLQYICLQNELRLNFLKLKANAC
jgi:hypothetical protein